ncbi:MAG: hypothetical protein DIU78_010005 [Pseudomonadota bacterium]|nr:MAG: hypothetical protein DIU78_06350 [Pseudomonadota bacterium]
MKPLDVARLRHNWDRALGAVASVPPAQSAAAVGELDPYAEAERVFEGIRKHVLTDFAAHARSLRPFLDEAAALLRALREGPGASGDELDADPKALRERLRKTLWDLEDLLEVYSGIGLS